MDNSKYYIMHRKGDQAYPMLRVDDREYDNNGSIKLMLLELNTPIPQKPVMADFLYTSKDIVSKRIAEVMQHLNMEGVQFIPTKLTMPKGEIIEDYVCVLVDNNTYEAMDKEKSDYTKGRRSYNISKIVLDRKILEEIPLNKRLGFRLKENPGHYLYHESVIEKIITLNPTGVSFIDIEEYEF